LERGLVNLAVGLKALGLTKLTKEDLESLFERIMKKTLGQLIADVRPQVNVSDELEHEIMETLYDRNYIAHRFFAEHDISFMSDHGRSNMIDELRGIMKRIRKVDHELELMAHSLWRRLGLTEEIFQKELEEMAAEAKQLDRSS
jgi:spore coat protein CotH